MKKSCLIFVFILFAFASKSQYWAPPNSEWHYSELFFWSYTIVEDYIKLEYEKDTIFNGITCSKIIKRHQPLCWGRPEYELMYFEDDKVFVWEPLLEKFQVIYDFSLNKGDSYMFEIADLENEIDTAIVTIDSVGNELIGGVLKKKFYVTYYILYDEYFMNDTMSYSSVIIETIGDTYYMFNYMPEEFLVCDGNFSNGLRCYYDEDLELYETGIAPYCDYIEYVGVDEIIETEDFTITSPFSESLIIQNLNSNYYEYTIYDHSGRVVNSGILNTGNITVRVKGKGLFIVLICNKNGKVLLRSKIIGI